VKLIFHTRGNKFCENPEMQQNDNKAKQSSAFFMDNKILNQKNSYNCLTEATQQLQFLLGIAVTTINFGEVVSTFRSSCRNLPARNVPGIQLKSLQSLLYSGLCPLVFSVNQIYSNFQK
jgi:hypothetical protein